MCIRDRLAVQQGKVDMVAAGVSVDEARQKVMDFSSKYVDSTEVVVVNASQGRVSTPTFDELNDKIVGVQQGNIADLYVSDEENCKPEKIVRYTTVSYTHLDVYKRQVIERWLLEVFRRTDMLSNGFQLIRIRDY